MNKEEIGYAWNFVSDLGNGRQFSLSGNFCKGISLEAINAEVDMVRKVFDRQQAKSAARGAADEIEQLQLRVNMATEDLLKISEKSKDKQLSSAERQQREAAFAHVEKMGIDIDYKKSVLARLKEEAK